MEPISFKRHRFPPEVIRHAVWLYFRFTLSIRDVEELLASAESKSAAKLWAPGRSIRPFGRKEPAPTAVSDDGPVAPRRDGGEVRRGETLAVAGGGR